jgi:hypothetical protein
MRWLDFKHLEFVFVTKCWKNNEHRHNKKKKYIWKYVQNNNLWNTVFFSSRLRKKHIEKLVLFDFGKSSCSVFSDSVLNSKKIILNK